MEYRIFTEDEMNALTSLLRQHGITCFGDLVDLCGHYAASAEMRCTEAGLMSHSRIWQSCRESLHSAASMSRQLLPDRDFGHEAEGRQPS